MTAARTSLALLVSCLSWACAQYGSGMRSAPLPSYGGSALTLIAPGIALEQPETLHVAARIENTGREAATDVQITSLKLASATLVTPVPITVGEIGAEQSAIVQATFKGYSGRRAQFMLEQADGKPVPFGASVKDSQTGKQLGIADPSGKAFVLLPQDQGTLAVKWKEGQCQAPYALPKAQGALNYQRQTLRCR